MAIISTGAIYKSLVFDGESSRDYGIYITGQAVYNAPERDVEMINIPGRNGSFALDKGRFQNIEVTYPAGIFADNETDFAQGISDFRNFLCSRNGYVRLTDEYNPGEYRMAVYKSGLDVSPAQLKAGEFDIVFDCKPQRFLTSGEEPITIGEWHETETVSGEIASFEAEAGDAVKSLVADIEPIQSLNGYDKPWSGGNGVNKLSPSNSETKTSNGVTCVSDGNGKYTLSGTASGGDAYFVFPINEQYTLKSGDYLHMGNSVAVGTFEVDFTNNTASYPSMSPVNKIFDLASHIGKTVKGIAIIIPNGSAFNGTVQPMICNTSSATSFAPYSNICPISGHDEVNVTRSGRNLLPPWTSLTLSGVTFDIASDGSIIANGENQTGYNEAIGTKTITLPAGTYTVSGGGSLPIRVEVFNVTQNKTYWEGGTKTFTYNGTDLLQAWIYVEKNVAMDNVVLRPQIELGSSVSAYEPYQSYATYTTNLSGTRYGGTVDVVSGVLTVDRAMVDLGSLPWNKDTNREGNFYTFNLDIGSKSTLFAKICSGYSVNNTANANTIADGELSSMASYGEPRVFVKDLAKASMTATDFKTAVNGIQLCYELATPTTVQLTAQEVELLVGLNQVWANSGDVSVEYGTAPNVLINPTLFESSPMLEVEGYGTIAFNGYEIRLQDAVMGEVPLADRKSSPHLLRTTLQLAALNDGDTITVQGVTAKSDLLSTLVTITSVSNSNNSFTTTYKTGVNPWGYAAYLFTTSIDSLTAQKGSDETIDNTLTVAYTYNGTAYTTKLDISIKFLQTSANEMDFEVRVIGDGYIFDKPTMTSDEAIHGKITGYSSTSILGNPTYIDCDLGECYMIKDGDPVSLNRYIDLGSDLPKLVSGANEITTDNTVTDLKVIPRWWRV